MTVVPLSCGVHESLIDQPCPACAEATVINRIVAEASGRAWRESWAAPDSTEARRAEAVERIANGERRKDVARDFGVSGETIRLWCIGRTSGYRRVG